MELKTHNLNNFLGLIHLGLDTPKMLSTSNAHLYFSTCLQLTGTIRALSTKHMLTCSAGRCPEHAAGGRLRFTMRNARGLPVSRTPKLQKLPSFAAQPLLSGAILLTPRALRGVTVPLTLRCPHRSICRWFNNVLMCGARSHPLVFWDLINSALHMFTITDCLKSWL